MATQDSRIRIKRSTVTTQVPTVAPSLDHTDGTWTANNIYVGELFANVADDRMFIRTNNGIREVRMFDPADACACIHTAKLVLTSADILSGNTSPVPFGLTVPAGYYARVIKADWSYVYGTVAYATNTRIQIKGTSDDAQCEIDILGAGSNRFVEISPNTGVSTMFTVGSDLYFKVKSGNPTAGDGTATIYLTYLLIEQ